LGWCAVAGLVGVDRIFVLGGGRGHNHGRGNRHDEKDVGQPSHFSNKLWIMISSGLFVLRTFRVGGGSYLRWKVNVSQPQLHPYMPDNHERRTLFSALNDASHCIKDDSSLIISLADITLTASLLGRLQTLHNHPWVFRITAPQISNFIESRTLLWSENSGNNSKFHIWRTSGKPSIWFTQGELAKPHGF
jgi:hypothetical protein